MFKGFKILNALFGTDTGYARETDRIFFKAKVSS